MDEPSEREERINNALSMNASASVPDPSVSAEKPNVGGARPEGADNVKLCDSSGTEAQSEGVPHNPLCPTLMCLPLLDEVRKGNPQAILDVVLAGLSDAAAWKSSLPIDSPERPGLDRIEILGQLAVLELQHKLNKSAEPTQN